MSWFKTNQSGQTLIFVAATMVIALSVGVGIALRSLSSVSRVTSTDTAARALAAAEGGAEKYLSLSNVVLEDAYDYYDTGEGSGSCPSGTAATTVAGDGGCEITYVPTGTDTIRAKATVTVERAGEAGAGEYYATVVEQDRLVEVNLDSYGTNDLKFCWTVIGTLGFSSDIHFLAYGMQGANYTFARGGVRSLASRDAVDTYETGDNTAGNFGNSNGPDGTSFDDCYTIDSSDMPNGVKGLRIQMLNAPSELAIFPQGGNTLPYQGYKIVSVGELVNVGAEQRAIRTVEVFRSLPYLPSLFNFGVYSHQGSL